MLHSVLTFVHFGTLLIESATMTQAPSKRAAAEVEREDIITALPRNVVDRILELLPVRDAARTCVLSKKWRDIWVSLPHLVLDNLFCKKLIAKCQFFYSQRNSESVLRETVDEILLQHIGDIVKFVLDISAVHLSSYDVINGWMRYVTRNGVKELTLKMSDNTTYLITYKLPSFVFNCPTLTHLELSNCDFKPPNPFLGFQNVRTLNLEEITFVPTTKFCVINVPLLVGLTLKLCHRTQCLKIVSPQLESLVVRGCHHLVLNCFMNCKKLSVLGIELEKVVDILKHDEISTLEKLLFSVPLLEQLYLGPYVLELLSANIIPDGLPSKLNCLWHLDLGVDFGKVDHTSFALQLIKSSPNLSKLQIWVKGSDDSAETVMKYLETPTCLDQPLNKLDYVTISSFDCSKTELLFVKLLCARTPSLVRMCIEQGIAINSKEERNVTITLMRFPRASTKAELFYFPFEATNAD
ncbi:F-box/FBD/LRR-repeat protein At1g13570-like [Lycium ferocissimum]|uniref:F-box/FBD/LRR-repeat protein At1g13570-like n=1 Tax=Lycium ferocissimum TaxID=112874 RepID=UPI0028166358|nr:F-box/FBD/LRR-repeat protein At1g13570-like [Lycium ferocissimum]